MTPELRIWREKSKELDVSEKKNTEIPLDPKIPID